MAHTCSQVLGPAHPNTILAQSNYRSALEKVKQNKEFKREVDDRVIVVRKEKGAGSKATSTNGSKMPTREGTPDPEPL